MPATIRYYQNLIVDGNFRVMNAASEQRLGQETLAADGSFAPAPVGSTFCTIETDTLARYEREVSVDGVAVPRPVTAESSPLQATAFVEQGPITVEGGDVINLTFF